MSLLAIFGTLLGVSLPIVAWGYVFSYFGGLQFGGRKFFLGIVAGSFAVVPILYAPEIFNELKIPHFISVLSQESEGIGEILKSFFLSSILPILVFILAIAILYFPNIRQYARRILILVGGGLAILAGAVALLSSFSGNSGQLTIQGVMLHGFPIIAAFYIFVAGLEEILKHLGIYSSSSLGTDSRKEVLLVAVYIALGFVFLENMLYLTGGYNQDGFGANFFGLLFSRSIISLLLHIFATMLLTVGFYAWFKDSNKQNGGVYLKYFLLAVGAHAIFNIALTYNTTWILPIYAIIGYFFLTSVFFGNKPVED